LSAFYTVEGTRPAGEARVNNIERELTAYHEAGHAMIAWAVYRPFAGVSIKPDEYGMGGLWRMRGREYCDVQVDLAGFVAECIRAHELGRLETPDSTFDGSTPDMNQALQLIRELFRGETEEKLAQLVQDEMQNLSAAFEDPRVRPALDAIATLLLDRETIQYYDVQRLILQESRLRRHQ
jgi:ATP-dependent Zn protease